ncbi:GrpB family protein [Thalassotalea maritima]|uniref:GrpB family protein n=1 Tax=Thalassotalea maritima TaxID=3242416 RepID=UPI003527612C
MSIRVIQIVDYDPSWQTKFASEKLLLAQAIGSNAINIEHIGSTSVIGLSAKPVIDILIEVSSLTELDGANEKLEALGYKVKGENGISGRRYFQKGGNRRSHHVHAFQSNNLHLIRHIAFREYLIANPELASRYGTIKKQAASQCKNNINTYMALKNDFIEKHEKLAVEWFKNDQ